MSLVEPLGNEEGGWVVYNFGVPIYVETIANFDNIGRWRGAFHSESRV